ncbi:alanine racemase [uncultured Cohaesibacter sp.]|uniref:alanine racemase n=1 Tax=uncultured Cohaesibacter sp. TaxID=1002546 RepID=UPI00292CD425|nr:alanine racemase [uncultured Cohaesibacter sp.]
MNDRPMPTPSHITHFAPSDSHTAGSLLTIDLTALADNYRQMAERTGSAECAAVIKADAYGTGLEAAADCFWQAGCRTFFVAHPQEGAKARKRLPEAVIYVLNGLVGDDSDDCMTYYRDYNLRPVLGCLAELEIWQAFCAKNVKPLSCAIHFDTGMNRLGLSHQDAVELSKRWKETPPSFDLSLIISHLACADEPDHSQNRDQLKRFSDIRSLFPGVNASLANSSGVFLGPDYHFDLCRPGIALYGGAVVDGKPSPMQVVATLQSRILATRDVAEGQPVSYGATQTTKRQSRLAILCVGYADGFLRTGSSNDTRAGAIVSINGHNAPVIGRITMDLIIVDVTDIPEDKAQRGDWAELFGSKIAIDDVAKAANTISYELLTSLGLRALRRYQ